MKFEITDLSLAGVCFRGAAGARLNSRVEMELGLIGQPPIEASAIVCWVGHDAIGVQFEDLAPEAERALEQGIIRECAREEHPWILIAVSDPEGVAIAARLKSAGLIAHTVRTPLDIIAAIEFDSLPVGVVLVQEQLASELREVLRYLGSDYPQLRRIVLTRCEDSWWDGTVFDSRIPLETDSIVSRSLPLALAQI